MDQQISALDQVASNRKSLKERANYCFFAEAEIAAVRPVLCFEQNGNRKMS
jgi:hypothetical protein